MSFRPDHFLRYKVSDEAAKVHFLEGLSNHDIRNLFLEILYGGVHGFCFSIYEDGQKPGDIIGEEQIRKRLEILKPYTRWVRSFSCTEGNELVPRVARQLGMKTLVGAWLGKDKKKNRQEIDNLISLAGEGLVDIAAVGNEVLYRKDLKEEELISFIRYVKDKVPGIAVGYVDAYYEFAQKPAITELCDVILSNCYPYWEGTDFNYSLSHMQDMFRQAKLAAKGKPVIITETGWPSRGESFGNSVPSPQAAMKYFINTQLWAMDENIEVFYFSSFDEAWKVGDEGDVGAYWGVWDKLGKLKYIDQ
jgi:glucan 1,3-beta-glucosidase